MYLLRRILSALFLGVFAGLALGVTYKAVTYKNKKNEKFDYNSYGNSQRED